MTLTLDHLAISATDLASGVAHVESVLGVPLAGGGEHAHMSTHNRLLHLGDIYLEVIAINPAAPAPAWPRWFDLDNFAGPPRLTNWICRTDNLAVAVAASPAGVGVPVQLARGDFRWQMAVPADGKLPYDNLFPALIEWQGSAHPAPRLPDQGVRLRALHITHPAADALQSALAPRLSDPRLQFHIGPTAGLRAEFSTPTGIKSL